MNNHRIGLKNELRLRKELEKLGWLTEHKPWSRYGGKDFWGIFDIVALRNGEVSAIQVKTNDAKRLEVWLKYQKVKRHIPKSWNCQLWVWKGRQGWVTIDFADLRKFK